MAPNKEYLLVVDYFLNQLIRCLGSKKKRRTVKNVNQYFPKHNPQMTSSNVLFSQPKFIGFGGLKK